MRVRSGLWPSASLRAAQSGDLEQIFLDSALSQSSSFRLEMLQVARVAPKTLGDSASLVSHFLRSQITQDGAFPDREGRPDLYYTVFGLEAMLALREELPAAQTAGFLRSIEFVTMAVLGGLGSILGSVVGAALLTVLPQLLTVFHDYEHIALGLIMIVFMIFLRAGIVPSVLALARRSAG